MKKNRNTSGSLVYSTDGGRHCPTCRTPLAACTCNEVKAASVDGWVRIRRESKGRGGKVVTVISGVPLPQEELSVLAAQLKKRCGCGGTLKQGVIEIQGEHLQLLLETLKQQGFRVKQSGG